MSPAYIVINQETINNLTIHNKVMLKLSSKYVFRSVRSKFEKLFNKIMNTNDNYNTWIKITN